MSLLQMVGGVAVAGAVAAGTSAFTASGLSNTITGSSVVGGKISQTVEGAELTAASFTTDASNGNPDNVTGVNIGLQGANGATLSTSSTVKVVFTGTAGGGASATVTCSFSSGTTWNCPVAGAPTSYFTAVSKIDVSVVAP